MTATVTKANMVDETQIYAALDAQEQANVTGYEEGSGHEFLAGQHRRILEAQLGQDQGGEWAKLTEGLNRETLKLQMAVDASNLLGQAQAAYAAQAAKTAAETGLPDMSGVTATRLAAQQQVALAAPEKAAAMAVVEANAPVGTPSQKLSALAWQESQLGTLAKSVEGKKWIFSKDSYAADLGAMLVNPSRTIYAQSRAGSELLGGKLGYYKLLEQWHTLPQAEQERLWDDVFARLKEASGGNDLVLFGLVNPLIYADEVNAPYVDAAFDVLDTAFSAFSVYTLAKGLKKALAYRGRALKHGNRAEAGKATVEGIKAGDVDAVDAGHPIGGETTGPTQIHIEEELRKTGRLQADQELVTKAPGLTPVENTRFLDDSRERITVTGGRIVDETPTRNGVEFTFEVEEPGNVFTVTDLAKTKGKLEAALTKATNDVKLAIQGTEPGQSSAEVTKLTREIEVLKDSIATVDAAITEGKTSIPLMDAPKTVVKKVEFYRTEDHVGKVNFRDRWIGVYSHLFGTPESRIGKLMDGIVSYGTNMRQQQRRVFGYFDKEVKRLRHGFSKSEGSDVDALLITGDRLKKVYSDADLAAGVNVDGIGKITFNEKQIAGYKRIRSLFDDLYGLVNRMQVDELIFGGYEMFFGKLTDKTGKVIKDVRVFGKTNDIRFARPVHDMLGERRVATAIDMRQGSATKGLPVQLDTLADLETNLKAKKSGFVKLRNQIIQGDDSKYGYALVDVDSLGKAKGAFKPDVALEYRPGYVPKLAQENVRFIVERPKQIIVDGEKVTDTVILRGFETEAEAKIYLAKLQSRGRGKDAQIQQLTAQWRGNPRNKEKVEFIDNSLFRGAFVGHRHEQGKFKVGLAGKEATRVSSFDALQRYADYTAAYAPMHEYKQASIKRFMNTAGDKLQNFRWDAKLVGSDAEWRRLKALQDHMKATFAVPTTEESLFAGLQDVVLSTLESVIYDVKKGKARPGFGKLKALHHWIATSRSASDPVSYIKGINFDLMLGSFNPAQFFVQSAGMFIPTTTHPVQALKTLPDFLFFRSSMHFDDYAAAAEAGAKLGMNKRRTMTILHAWHRSGIPSSILENADFGHYAGTHGAYYSPSMFNRIRDKSRMFYNAGEMNNRLFSFLMAFDRKTAEHGWDITKPLNDTQINEVIQESLRLGTNMTAGNKAKWQDGILGLPTQFWQQTHKYYENLFYGLAKNDRLGIIKENQWTRAESITALGMNVLMFGAAGYGLDELKGDLDRWMVDPQGLGLDPEKDGMTMAYLRGGFLEMMSLNSLGFELDLTDRTGPANGMFLPYEKIFKPFVEAADDGKLAEGVGKMLFGPTGTIATRTVEAGKMFFNLMHADANSMEWDAGTLLDTLRSFTHASSTGLNIDRAVAWGAANDILNSKGLPLYIVEDGQEIPMSVLVAKSLGFDPLAKEKKEALIRRLKDMPNAKAEMSRALTDEYRRYFRGGGEAALADSATVKAANRRIALLKQQIVKELGYKALTDIMTNVNDTLNKEMSQYGMDDWQKQLYKAIHDYTIPSETEQKLMNDWIIMREVAKIKGTDPDAE